MLRRRYLRESTEDDDDNDNGNKNEWLPEKEGVLYSSSCDNEAKMLMEVRMLKRLRMLMDFGVHGRKVALCST